MPRARKPDVGRIPPVLVTPAELRAAIAVTIARLATREDIRAEERETRRHIDVVAESLRTEIRSIAEARRSR